MISISCFSISSAIDVINKSGFDCGDGYLKYFSEYFEHPARAAGYSSAVTTDIPCLPRERVTDSALRCRASNTNALFICNCCV